MSYALTPDYAAQCGTVAKKTPDSFEESFNQLKKVLTEHACTLEKLRIRLEEGTNGLSRNEELATKCQESISAIDTTFKNSLDIQVGITLPSQAAMQTSTYVNNNRAFELVSSMEELENFPLIENPANHYEAKLTRMKSDHESLTRLEKYKTTTSVLEGYTKFRRAIFNASHEEADEEMPDIELYVQGEDDELVVERAAVSYKCPLSRTWLVDPVTSSKCGHSFSRAAILEVFQTNLRSQAETGVIKCPVGACKHQYAIRDLKMAPELAKKADAQRRREAQQTQLAQSELDVI